MLCQNLFLSCDCVNLCDYGHNPKLPAGHGFTGMVVRETGTDTHPKIGRMSQSGAFFVRRLFTVFLSVFLEDTFGG